MTSSLHESNNQSNNHAEDNSQTQPQNSQKLDLTKNSKKFAKKVLTTNLIATSPMTNGGFDEATWGKLDVNDWKGSVQGDYYQLTDYTGNANHVIVPNEADFEKAGISTSGKQVGVTRDLMHTIFAEKATATDATVAFSKTDNKMVKAISHNWTDTWNSRTGKGAKLSKFDGTNLDVSNMNKMTGMFFENKLSDLSSFANWDVSHVGWMDYVFTGNQISDISPLKNWNTNNLENRSGMFDDNSSIQIKTSPAKRIISFIYPDGYTGKKQVPITQTVDVPTQKVKVDINIDYDTPMNNISNWVTKTEIPISKITDPVYFQDYTVPEIKGLLEPDKTVISKQQADITKPINVTVTYKLVESNTNDAFALDSKHGLREHTNVNDNGGYDSDFWGKINVDNWNYTVNGDRIEINGLKDSISTGTNDAVIVPNLDDFKLAGKDGDAKAVYISSSVLGKTAQHKYYGLSKTNGNTFATDSDISNAFKNDSNLTHADLNSLDTSSVTNMNGMFSDASSLTSLDVSNWDTGNVTGMIGMFNGASSLTSLDVSNWNTGKVTNMASMFNSISSLTSLDVSKWKTGKVINMSYMFNNASKLTDLDVSNWDTGNVTDMHWMFGGASSLTSLDVSKWKTGNVTDMNDMFDGASGLTSLNVSKWDTGSVTDMNGIFDGASSLTNLDVSHWDTSKVTNMSYMFNNANSLTSLDVSNWDTSKVTDMSYMFSNDPKLDLIINRGKFADYLVNHDDFADSKINSDVKSVTTDNTKLLKLLTNDVQHNSATRTIVFTFPANYSPDLAKYHLTKIGNTYQIKQSADYDKLYLQGTILINATDDIAEHHIDMTKPYKLSDTWQPNYDKLVLAHKNSDGSVSFDAIQLPKVPGYKAHLVRNKINPAMLMVSFMAVPSENKPSLPNEETPSKPSANPDNTNKSADNLQQRVATKLNSNDSVWTMPVDVSNSTYTVEVPKDATIDLSDLVIAEPVHAQTTTQIHVTKRFKLNKKHVAKYLKHRKRVSKLFSKHYALL